MATKSNKKPAKKQESKARPSAPAAQEKKSAPKTSPKSERASKSESANKPAGASKAAAKKTATKKAGAKKTSSRAQAAALARSKKAASLIERDWLDRKNSSQQEEAATYSMKTTYTLNTVIEHPRFGTGFVTAVLPHKIQVTFQSQVLFLVHAREAS